MATWPSSDGINARLHQSSDSDAWGARRVHHVAMSHSQSFEAWQHAQRAADEAGYRFHLQACGAPAQITCQAERDESAQCAGVIPASSLPGGDRGPWDAGVFAGRGDGTELFLELTMSSNSIAWRCSAVIARRAGPPLSQPTLQRHQRRDSKSTQGQFKKKRPARAGRNP